MRGLEKASVVCQASTHRARLSLTLFTDWIQDFMPQSPASHNWGNFLACLDWLLVNNPGFRLAFKVASLMPQTLLWSWGSLA